MKKKLIIILIPILLIIIGVTWKIVTDKKKQNYYQEIRENIQEDIKKYLKISSPYCDVVSPTFVINENILVIQYGMDKEKLLDIDGKSYCKVNIKVRCVAKNELNWITYLKCKDYEDEGYNIEK